MGTALLARKVLIMWIFIPARANTQTIREQATGRVLRTQDLPATPAWLLHLETGQTISVLKSAEDYRLLIDYPTPNERSIPLEFGFATEESAEARLRLFAQKLEAVDLTSDTLTAITDQFINRAARPAELVYAPAGRPEEAANGVEAGKDENYPQSRRF